MKMQTVARVSRPLALKTRLERGVRARPNIERRSNSVWVDCRPGGRQTPPDSDEPSMVEGALSVTSRPVLRERESAGRLACTMQPPRRCTTQSRRIRVGVPRNSPDAERTLTFRVKRPMASLEDDWVELSPRCRSALEQTSRGKLWPDERMGQVTVSGQADGAARRWPPPAGTGTCTTNCGRVMPVR